MREVWLMIFLMSLSETCKQKNDKEYSSACIPFLSSVQPNHAVSSLIYILLELLLDMLHIIIMQNFVITTCSQAWICQNELSLLLSVVYVVLWILNVLCKDI